MTNQSSCAVRLPARPAGEVIDFMEARCRLSAPTEENLTGLSVERYPSAALCPGQAVSPLPLLPRRSRARRARRAAWGQIVTTGAALMATLLVTIQFL